jgi:hypothetical protein
MIIEVRVPQFLRLPFAKTRKSGSEVIFQNRFFPLLSWPIVPVAGEEIDIWSQIHFATDTFEKNSSFVSTQLRFHYELEKVMALTERSSLPGTELSPCPGKNLKPRKFKEESGALELDPIGVYEQIERRGALAITAKMVRPGSRIWIAAWAWARSSSATDADYLTVGGGDKAPTSGDYSQLLIIRHQP